MMLLSYLTRRAPASIASFRHVRYASSSSSIQSSSNNSNNYSNDEMVSKFMSSYSIEVTPNAAKKIKDFANIELLKPNTTVNVTYLVGADIDESVSICKRLADANMNPVAHVPSRAFASLIDVEDYLVQLKDVGVKELLLLGGGADVPKGELHESMQILESGLIQKYEFSKIGVAAHPEGHPDINPNDLQKAILQKAEWAYVNSMPLYYETQFCFESKPILDWEIQTRQEIIQHLTNNSNGFNLNDNAKKMKLPSVQLGIAGPATISNLIKFGAMSGVGNSLNFLTKYSGNVFKLATKHEPTDLILDVAKHYFNEDGNSLIDGLHFYPFGGFKSTLKWVHQHI